MSRIRIMPENLANQIAAGEVVERPAAVVKELLENAIDAGSLEVTVHAEGNGTRLLRVIDNGAGMDQDDVLLCLERHATSKLSSLDQLGSILTLGFRGEALPSIASVSRLTITSRPAGSELGTRAEVHFGRVTRVHEMGGAAGTAVEVRDLFGNVPARRKFLKSARTELAHIEEVVRNYGLVRPGIGMTLSVDGRTVLTLPARTDTLETRFRRIFGLGAGDPLVDLLPDRAGDSDGIVLVSGFLLPPEKMPPALRLRAFVNGRAVRDRMVTGAVMAGLQGFLMKGRQPAGALFLELPPEMVDVNVHPAKLEVRFREAARIHRQIAETVSAAVKCFQESYRETLFSLPPSKPEIDVPVAAGVRQSALAEGAEIRPLPWSPPVPARAAEPAATYVHEVVRSAVGADRAFVGLESAPLSCRLIGQLKGLYILCETTDGLVVVDQHAAHERLLYESMKRQFEEERIPAQVLLFPITMEVGPAERELLGRHADEIARLGYNIEEFGGGTVAVKAIPAVLSGTSPGEAVAALLARFQDAAEDGRAGTARGVHDVIASLACKAAVRAGDELSGLEMEKLLAQMQTADIFSHCPHGRPVMKRISEKEIQRWFNRSA